MRSSGGHLIDSSVRDVMQPKARSVSSIIIVLLLIGVGCQSPRYTERNGATESTPEKEARKAELTIVVGSIDLSTLRKRIENTDVTELAAILRREKIDILALEGLTRYPDLPTRIDLLTELSRETDMRSEFGETITISGRQTGNAVFSSYPIRISENTHYDKLQSNGFGSALQAVVDCGVRDVVIVSTRLPDDASMIDQGNVTHTLARLTTFYINNPVIITGNLPRSKTLVAGSQYRSAILSNRDDIPRYWFSDDNSIAFVKSSIERTPLGPMAIAHFDLFGQQQP